MTDTHKEKCSVKALLQRTAWEWTCWFNGLRRAEFNFGLAFAIICVLVVIIGNVVLLVSLNFWLSIFPTEEMESNSSQIAVQVIVCCLLVMSFASIGVLYVALYGARPLWRALVDKNRVRGPCFRLLLLFGSGATNALTSVLAVYSMSHTPEFVQAVFLSVIPFCAQVWTYLLVPEERRRCYFSVSLMASFIFCVAGVLLSSLSSFLVKSDAGKAAPWDWALVYLVSAVVFGLWCVVQRLYLDAIMFRQTRETPRHFTEEPHVVDSVNAPSGVAQAPLNSIVTCSPNHVGRDGGFCSVNAADNRETSPEAMLLLGQREWGKQNENDFAAKTVLLLVGILFQTLVSFACLPVDAIPWFGTSATVTDAWHGFRRSCSFIFESWENVRYGLLHTVGFFMSFVGCAYLNERSPTLASVVLQLAGPITSLVLIIVPKWDVYGEHGTFGHKLGGVFLLLLAGLMYHVWDQVSLHEMLSRQLRQQQEQEEQQEDLGRAREEVTANAP